MKKLIFTSLVVLMLATMRLSAQALLPTCTNNVGLENRIDAVENSGWVELNREFVWVNYLVAPEPPYLIGTLYVYMQPDCGPGEPCPRILRLYVEEAWQESESACVWRRVHF